jgi:hypothetical protein
VGEQEVRQMAQVSAEVPIVQNLSSPLFEAKGWMRLLGVIAIIEGIILALTIVGIVIAWLPIWMGFLLLKAAGSTETAHLSGSSVEFATAMKKLRTFFTIQGVLALLGILGTIIAIFITIASGVLVGLAESGVFGS